MSQQHSTGRTSRAAWLALPVLLAVLGAVWAWCARGPGWQAQALRSGLFVRCALMLGGGAAALQVLLGAMARLARPGRAGSVWADQRGSTMVEFSLLFIVAFPIVLIMIQVSLMMVGNVFTHYAAFCAARSATVWIPAHLAPDEPRNVLGPQGASRKYARIRQAAVLAVLPAAGTAQPRGGSGAAMANTETIRQGLMEFFRADNRPVPGWMGRTFARKHQYAGAHTEVWVDPPGDGHAYQAREDIRVTVEHRFYLSFPYLGRLFGEEIAPGQYAAPIRANCTLVNQGRSDEVFIEKHPATGLPLVPMP